jgi:hypothetical protein
VDDIATKVLSIGEGLEVEKLEEESGEWVERAGCSGATIDR